MSKDMTTHKDEGIIQMNSARAESYSPEAARKENLILNENNNMKQRKKAWYLKPAAIFLGALCLTQYCRHKEKASKLINYTHIHVEVNNVFYIKNCGGREDQK